MSTARSVRPTDLVALVALDGRVYANEARTWDRLGHKQEGPRLLESALEPWFSFATGRHTWISVEGQRVRGLISARRRGNRTAWEVNCLIAVADDEPVVLDLFDRLSTGVGQAGAQKIFLRLPVESDLLPPARRAGFVPYSRETLLRLDGSWPQTVLPAELRVRVRTDADNFALYRLYNATIPEHVRRMEALTFQEWQASSEKRTAGRARRDLVVARSDEIVSHLQSSRDSGLGRIDATIHPSVTGAMAGLISLAISGVETRRPLYCLVPSCATGTYTYLIEAGFVPDEEYVVLVKRLAMPIPEEQRVRAAVVAPHPLAVV